jgi:hypothetical protein
LLQPQNISDKLKNWTKWAVLCLFVALMMTPSIVVHAEPLPKEQLYQKLELGQRGLSKKAFDIAFSGFEKLLAHGKLMNSAVLSIVDFSLPSTQKRLFVINVITQELIFYDYVAHGKNSGAAVAKNFSNKINSLKSSLGFFVTQNTYTGKNGLSLALDGKEKGMNDHALARSIVIHGAPYVNENFASHKSGIGRSWGCPAVPENINRLLIETIKDGSCFFIYAPIYKKESASL